MTNDKITVSRELLRQTIDLLDDMLAPGATFSTASLRAAVEQTAVEPVAWRFRKNGHWAFRNDNVQGLVCEPLFATPVPESVYKSALDEWLDKTEWVQKTVKTHELGMHWADVLRQRIEAAQQPAPPADVPMLSIDDVFNIIRSTKHLPLGEMIRLTERVVRQKAGLK